jgi:putative hydrolase of the HAD superfamily
MRDALFGHEDWGAFNRGELSEAELIQEVARRTGWSPDELTRVLDIVRESLVEKLDTVALLRALHRRAMPLYCLSDMPTSVFNHVRQRYDFWDLFQGIVVSGEVQMMKPGRAIFERLLLRYRISAEETVFVDDHQPNIEGARALGLDTILFSDAAQCRRELCTRLNLANL